MVWRCVCRRPPKTAVVRTGKATTSQKRKKKSGNLSDVVWNIGEIYLTPGSLGGVYVAPSKRSTHLNPLGAPISALEIFFLPFFLSTVVGTGSPR